MRPLLRASLSSLLAALLFGPVSAQTIEYDLTPLGDLPGADTTIATGLNDRGDVVGWSQFFGGTPSIRAWRWAPSTGFVALPQTPGQSNYRAVDINNVGVIAGDGAHDSGFAWRLENGTYTMLGALPGDGRSIVGGINEAGEITGTSWSFQFTIPKKAYFAAPGAAMYEIVRGQGTAINERGQVCGWATAFAPMRYSPASGLTMLPLVPGKAYHYAYGINNSGDIVGNATRTNGNGSVPYIYTDAGGAQEIGNFGGAAGAVAINDHGDVVGNSSPGTGGRPWIWNQATGLRFLSPLVDPTLGYSPASVSRINNRGQILARAFVTGGTGYEPVLLTPVAPSQPGFAFCFGDACPCGEDRLAGCVNLTGVGARLAGSGTSSLTADDLVLTTTELLPGTFGLVFAGTAVTDVVLGNGRRCVGGTLTRFPVHSATAQGIVQGPGIATMLGVSAGETVRFQCWYRDQSGCTGVGINLSNGYEVMFTP